MPSTVGYCGPKAHCGTLGAGPLRVEASQTLIHLLLLPHAHAGCWIAARQRCPSMHILSKAGNANASARGRSHWALKGASSLLRKTAMHRRFFY